MMRFLSLVLVMGLTMAVSITPARAQEITEQGFQAWLQDFRARAEAGGIKPATTAQALSALSLNDRVIQLDRKQPEGTSTFASYKSKVISQTRIDKGRVMMKRHAAILNRVSAEYGVQPQFLVALWGIETSFGEYTGNFETVRSLATLAYEGRRRELFERELMNALKIIDQGHVTAEGMKGSWAGALGQNQFMPSSFMAYATDFDGDGRKDIWGTLPDVFASSANYLKQSGWKGDERWGREVKVPAGLSKDLVSLQISKPLSEWAKMGLKTKEGGALPIAAIQASLVAPDGLVGKTYLVYDNYRVIMKWNRSTYFATCVGLLADLIAQ